MTDGTAARARIVAVAPQQPRWREDHTATWSLTPVHRRARGDGWPRIGRSTIRRVLQTAGSSYQRTRTWCPTGTALRQRKDGWVRVVDPPAEEKRRRIEHAYRLAAAAGIPVWCQDEAGPYQAIPQPGASWAPCGRPRLQPHEYMRGGTATMLTVVRPATGAVRATGVTTAPNAVLHPWLREELGPIIRALPAPREQGSGAAAPCIPYWWERRQERAAVDHDPPLRLILIWDKLAGHKSAEMGRWLGHQGILPVYTPLSGSWLTRAASVQRISARRALDGPHPESAAEIITWLEETVAGWTEAPTPFVWDGQRRERRRRARQRRLGGSAALADHLQFNAA